MQRQGGTVTVPTTKLSPEQMMTTMSQIALPRCDRKQPARPSAMLAEFRKSSRRPPATSDIAEMLRCQRVQRSQGRPPIPNVVMVDVRLTSSRSSRGSSRTVLPSDWRDTDHRQVPGGPASCNAEPRRLPAEPSARLSPEEQTALEIIGSDQTTRNRAIYSLFNEASDHAKARKEIEEDGETRMVPVLPWYPRSASPSTRARPSSQGPAGERPHPR